MKKSAEEKAVMVTTKHRGVFFGYATDTEGETIKLRSARMCIYWSANLRGVVGLASHGPDSNCKISPPATVQLRDVTAVFDVTEAAVKLWEAAPWRA